MIAIIRGISLLNAGYKIYSKIIKNELNDFYEEKLGEEQNGFRRGRSCADGYFTLKLLIEKHKEYNIETHLAFIDYIKAVDNVNRNKLFDILKSDDTPNTLLRAIDNIYSNNQIAIRINMKLSEWKNINQGVRQGFPLSPLFFNKYINAIIRRWRLIVHGSIKIGRIDLDTLLYADDQVPFASTERDYNYQYIISTLFQKNLEWKSQQIKQKLWLLLVITLSETKSVLTIILLNK